jgi:hypothetical protein
MARWRSLPGGMYQAPVLAGAVAPDVPQYPLSTSTTRARGARREPRPGPGGAAADEDVRLEIEVVAGGAEAAQSGGDDTSSRARRLL